MSDHRTAILVEEDYKGEYSRFALPPHAFYQRYPDASHQTWPPGTRASPTNFRLSPLPTSNERPLTQSSTC